MLVESSSLFSIQGSGSHGAPPFLVVLLASVALRLSVDEDCKGLQYATIGLFVLFSCHLLSYCRFFFCFLQFLSFIPSRINI